MKFKPLSTLFEKSVAAATGEYANVMDNILYSDRDVDSGNGDFIYRRRADSHLACARADIPGDTGVQWPPGGLTL